MPDIRLQSGFFDHPKTVKLERRCGAESVLGLERLWMHCAEYRTDGDLYGMSDEDLEIVAHWSGTPGQWVEAVTQVGYLDGTEGSRSVHDWVVHQPWVVESDQRKLQGRRAVLVRWHQARRHAMSPHPECPLCADPGSRRPALAAREEEEEEPSDDEEAEGDDGGDSNATQEPEGPKLARRQKRQKPPPSEAAYRCLKAWTDLYPITGSAAKPTGEAKSLDTLDKLMRIDQVPEEDVLTVCQWAAREWAPKGMIGSPAALREPTKAGDRKKWEYILHQARNGRHAGQEGRAVGAQWRPDASRDPADYGHFRPKNKEETA